MMKGDIVSMFGDSTSQEGESMPSSFTLAASEERGTFIADRDGDVRNMFPSPDQDSHCPHAKRPKMEHSNGKNLAKEKVEAEVRNLVMFVQAKYFGWLPRVFELSCQLAS